MRRVMLIVSVTLVLAAAKADAAFERVPGDARSGALSGAGVGWEAESPCPFGNPAQLARVRKLPVCMTRAGLYGIRFLGWNAVSGGTRFGRGAVGGGLAQLGEEDYRETTLAASLGFLWGSTAWGITLRFLNLAITGLASRHRVVLDAGLLEHVTEDFSVGVLVGGLGRKDDRFDRPRIQLGCAYRVGTVVSLLFDAEQSVERPRRLRVGIETWLTPQLVLRVGRVSEPGEISGGVGVTKGRLGVDLCVQWHAVLGFSERVTVKIGLRTED